MGVWDRTNKLADFRHCIFGKQTGTIGWGAAVRTHVRDSIIADSIRTGMELSDSDYNAFYNNTRNYMSTNPGTHDFSEENGNEINIYQSSFLYLPRIEDGSDLDGAASDGGDIGATVWYRIGRSGTLWGEEGYNETTNEPLWPFPNEDLIKEKMSQYTYDADDDGTPDIRGDRGFCADGTGLYGGRITLTSYIWEYLGNPCPVDVCNYYDVNRDGVVNVQDVQAVANVILGTASNDNADATGDGSVNVQDIQGIVNVILH